MAWIKNGDIYQITTSEKIISKLELGTYYLKFSQKIGFYLEKTSNFTLPKKIYGDMSIVKRWLKSYNNSDKNTCVMLNGLKGSGKTLASKKLAIESGLPIVIIDTAYCGTDFVTFMTNPCLNNTCVFIDEFDKVYSDHSDSSVSSLLNILDGTSSTNNLFVFTCNNAPNRYNMEYIMNRPSRVKYRTNYYSLDANVVNEVIDDLLEDKTSKRELIEMCDKLGVISFDTLISIIQEMNLFKESARECISYMNLSPETFLVNVEEFWKGKWYHIYTFNLDLSEDFNINRKFDAIPDEDYYDKDNYEEGDATTGIDDHINIDITQLVKTNTNTWSFESESAKVRFVRVSKSKYI